MRATAMFSLLATVLGAAACGQLPLAYGEANTVVAAMDPGLWTQVKDSVRNVLGPEILGGEERAFTVTYQDPTDPSWQNLQRFGHLLLVGTGSEPWMQKALQKAGSTATTPGLHSVRNVWSSGQTIDIVILSKPDAVGELYGHLSEIGTNLDEQYKAWVRGRMYLSGRNSALADTLLAQAGYSLVVPKVYTSSKPADSVYIFTNDQSIPSSQVIRQVMVTWQSPAAASFQPKDLLAWRASIVSKYYAEPQDVDLRAEKEGPFQYQGKQAYQIEALWKDPPEVGWPAAGPFILRAVTCPQQNRTYLLDAWLYAPGTDKYEYLIQLRTLLQTFRCGPS